jgi:predicted MFS family arabinose efflux permease
MLTIIIIVANNYIVYPYLSIFTDKVRVLDLPDKLWALMEIGVGGYILGRTAEKIKGAD